MEQNHFEILLEEIKSNFQLAFEGLDGVNGRLDRMEAWQNVANGRFDKLEVGQEVIKTDIRDILARVEKLEVNQETIKTDVRDIKRNMGLLNSIANDHETRLQGVENQIKDHIENHS